MTETVRKIEQLTRSQARAIGRKIKRAQKSAVKAIRSSEDGAAEAILELLRRMADELRAELRSIDAEKFAAVHYNRLLAEVDRLVDDFNDRARSLIDDFAAKGADLGFSFGFDQAQAIRQVPGLNVRVPLTLPDELLAVTRTLSTELIVGLGEQVRKELKGALGRAVLGQETPFQAAKLVADIVGPRGNVGAGAAADRIVRTEVNRAFNMATDSVGLEIEKSVPELKKRWLTAADSRVRTAHQEMNGVTVPVREPFTVPIYVRRKGVDVRTGSEKMDHPGDPAASAGNTINCRCRVVYLTPELEDSI